MSLAKALVVYRKELRQISRDRRTLMTIVFVPAFFLLLYGYALNWDIRHIALAVQDRDGTPESRALIAGLVCGWIRSRRPKKTIFDQRHDPKSNGLTLDHRS